MQYDNGSTHATWCRFMAQQQQHMATWHSCCRKTMVAGPQTSTFSLAVTPAALMRYALARELFVRGETSCQA